MKSINGKTRLVGLLGWPVGHSASPAMHNAAFEALGLNWAYVPLPVFPDRFDSGVEGLSALGFAGANVTVPHKQSAARKADVLTPLAEAIGAVNLLVFQEDGKVLGDNTDAIAFLRPLQQTIGSVEGKRIALLGSGGAARSAAYAAASQGATPLIFARNQEAGLQLAFQVRSQFPGIDSQAFGFSELERIGPRESVLVNCTPVGMWPQIDGCPWPKDLPLPEGILVYDLVYNPVDTSLLLRAQKQGCPTLDGRFMLVEQAALSLEAWTGKSAPAEVMLQACSHFLRNLDT